MESSGCGVKPSMLRLLCVLAIASQALCDTVLLNEIVDLALTGLNDDIRQSGKDTITIPDMKTDWKYRWHFVKLSGHLKCWDGHARSLATLRRTGDVVMTTEGNQITLKIALGLGTLEAGFHSCQFKAKHLLSVTQHISASVSSNSIEAQVTLVMNGDQCTSRLDKIALVQLGKIKVETGRGILHKIEDKIINRFVSHMHDKVVGAINSALQKEAYANFHKADLCNKIPH